MMKVEVQEALHHQLVAQQALVEVRMQGLDYKAEVDRRAERVMAAVEGQIGYLPGWLIVTLPRRNLSSLSYA